jgi:hypothetical protein
MAHSDLSFVRSPREIRPAHCRLAAVLTHDQRLAETLPASRRSKKLTAVSSNHFRLALETGAKLELVSLVQGLKHVVQSYR